MIDILSGDFSLKKSKPQIVIFENQKIGDTFKIIYKSSELEVEGGLGKVAKQKQRLGTTIIDGRRVPIISAEIGDASALSKETQALLSKAKVGKTSSQEQSKLLKNLEKETGISYEEQPINYVSPYRVPPITFYKEVKSNQQYPSVISYKPSNVIYGKSISYSIVSPISYNPSYSISKPSGVSSYKPSEDYKPSYPSKPSQPSKPSYPSYPSYPSPSQQTPSTPPTKIISYPREKFSTPKIKKGKYSVEIRRFGKFKNIGVYSTLQEAFNVGVKKTRGTLARTFKVIGGSTNRKLFGFYSKQSKKEGRVFIQKAIKGNLGTLGSYGEKAEIRSYRKLKGGRII